MMTNNPYYTCPIESSYMQKNHGMRFVDEFGAPLAVWRGFFEGGRTGRAFYNAYIHPEDLHMLKATSDDSWWMGMDGITIIEKRNSKPFFWPEGVKDA